MNYNFFRKFYGLSAINVICSKGQGLISYIQIGKVAAIEISPLPLKKKTHYLNSKLN